MSAVVSCDVLEENVKNTSDHLPIQIEISCSSKINNNNTNTTEASKVKWHSFTQDQITNLYRNPMEVKVQQYIRSNAVFLHNVEQWSTEDIDTCCETVIKLISDINDKLPRHSCKTGTKPYWSKGLNDHAKNKKRAWREWVSAGKPRDLNQITWLNYKERKRVLRKAQRHAQFIYECKYIEKIEKSENIDSKLFWHLINKRIKPRSISCNPLKKDNGEYVSDPTEIIKCWKNHFNDIYTPSIASNDVEVV